MPFLKGFDTFQYILGRIVFKKKSKDIRTQAKTIISLCCTKETINLLSSGGVCQSYFPPADPKLLVYVLKNNRKTAVYI